MCCFMTVGKGKGKARHGVQKKDNQREGWGHVPVSVPVKGGRSVFRVSVCDFPFPKIQAHSLDRSLARGSNGWSVAPVTSLGRAKARC